MTAKITRSLEPLCAASLDVNTEVCCMSFLSVSLYVNIVRVVDVEPVRLDRFLLRV